MDVTFTNVLEGARQYFQGLPINANSTSNSAYQNICDTQQRNNKDAKRNQELQQSPEAFWMGQPEQHCLPPRETTPNQRSSSYNSDSSRSPSRLLYVNTSQEQSKNFSTRYQEQSSSIYLHIPNQKQLQQHQQFPQHQSHLQPQSPRTQPPSHQFNHHSKQVHYQQQPQQQISQPIGTSQFQFTRPHYKDVLSNNSQYASHIPQNSAYHHQPQTSFSSPLPFSSPKSTRRNDQNKTLHSSNHAFQGSSLTPTSAGYINYEQSTMFHSANSHSSSNQNSADNENYITPQEFTFQQSSEMCDSNYYKHIHQQHSSSNSIYCSSASTTSPNQEEHFDNAYNNQTSRTHNLPPIAQFSDSYFKSVNENQKLYIGRCQSNILSAAPILNSNEQVSVPRNQNNYKFENQCQRGIPNQHNSPTSSTVSTSSSPINNVTRSGSYYHGQSLTSINNKLSSKPSQNILTQNCNSLSQQNRSINALSCHNQQRKPLGSKQRRESPLDLSVKTVRTLADSTLDDHDNDKSQYLSHIPPIASALISNYDLYNCSYQRTTASRRDPESNGVHAVENEYIPNSEMLANSSQNYHQRPTIPLQKNQKTSQDRRSSSASQYCRDTAIPYPTASTTTLNSFQKLDISDVGHGLKSSAVYPTHIFDIQRKRPADTAPSIDPKIPKTESWRQTIDRQIEQKLLTYKQNKEELKVKVTKESLQYNGNCRITKANNDFSHNYNTEYRGGIPTKHTFKVNEYNSYQNHAQTYVRSPSRRYNNNTNSTALQQNKYSSSELCQSNPRSSFSSIKSNSGSAADKKVLTLLRNSIETKSVKEAQRKYEQEQFNQYSTQPHHQSDVQQPSTHVTAPLQPRPTFMGRQNISPFTPNSLPEENNTTPSFNKLHVPRAIDSINSELNESIVTVANEQLEAMINDQINTNNDLDGLAAFLAARIRTKAELKQVSPTQQANNNVNNIVETVQNQIQAALKQENLFVRNSSGCSSTISIPRLAKEFLSSQKPRKKLFSRSEDDNGNASTKDIPHRDKSGLRSSSETSVFDFPDSESEGEMPVLEMQSLNAMRKDRKLSLKQTSSTEMKEVKSQLDRRPLTPEDDIFLQACDTFVNQLKAGVGKKRGRRKKTIEPDVLVKLEFVTKKTHIEGGIRIKEETPDEGKIDRKQQKTKSPGQLLTLISENGSAPLYEPPEEQLDLSVVKREVVDELEKKDEAISDYTNEEQQSVLIDSESETIEQLSKTLKNKVLRDLHTEKQPNELHLLVSKPTKKPSFGDGSAFYPGWEEEVYKYKKSLRMPPSLIQVRPPSSMRLSSSLPDLDPCHSPASSTMPEKDEDSKTMYSKVKTESFDSDIESNSGFNLFNFRNNYDSEGGSSIRSLPTPVKDSIVDKLLQKCGRKKKRKYKKKEESGPKVIPKAHNPVELLPTPSLDMNINDERKQVMKTEASILGFRKSTIQNFKNAFLNVSSNIVGIDEQFSTVILKTRTRKETRVMKQRATIKEVFGEDRPASAPPLSCINEDDGNIEEEIEEATVLDESMKTLSENSMYSFKNKVSGRDKFENNLFKSIADKKLRSEVLEDLAVDKDGMQKSRDQSPSVSSDVDGKLEIVSLDCDENISSVKKRNKMNKIRRKCSSGFDYIRKKKKQVKKHMDQTEPTPEKKKRDLTLKASPESEQDIRKEIKSWVLNKGVGETHLHRSARLGYTDITAYCLEKMECSPSPKDNAGYTPLHEACSRGHLDIARLLLMYGANVSESAKGGVRPLHEAIENGSMEIIRLLLSYGADPKLATYTGSTPLSLTSDENTRNFLMNHMDDLERTSTIPWSFNGPASLFDPKDTGCDVFSSPPHSDPVSEEEDIHFEVSEFLLPNLYTLKDETQGDRWILLQDLSNILKIKSRDALLKQICPTAPGTTPNYKSILRELTTSDFIEQAHCCQFLNASEKINLRASKIALVKYNDKIKELLNIEEVVITGR